MLSVERTHRFKKDFKLMLKRGKSAEKLRQIVSQLASKKPLETKHRDHTLTGNFSDSRECHIEPDWLLIYTPLEEAIRLERTGTHSDLFR